MDYHHGDLRSALVKAARSILEEHGIEKTSLRATAREAGVSEAAPYHHFKDKNALLSAVAADGFRDFTKALASAAASDEGAIEGHRASGVAYVKFATENPHLFRLMFGSARNEMKAPPGCDDDVKQASRDSFSALQTRAAATANKDKPDAEAALMALKDWAVVHGLATLFIDGRIDLAGYGAKDIGDLAARVIQMQR
ncbi:MAG: TetR/AcrR family transcriptional regulator [Pseudomonadota bacterium]